MDTIGKRIDEEPADSSSGEGDNDNAVLGSLDSEPADNALLNDTPASETLTLPKGALVAMRKSGGLRFTSRTVVIHRDGQVTQSSSTRSRNFKPPARLNKRQLSSLKHTVTKGMSGATAKSIGRQNPDAYAYEIVARTGRRVVTTVMFDGSIPASMTGLIKQLSQYLPSDK